MERAFPTPGDLADPGFKPVSPASPALAGRFVTTVPPGKRIHIHVNISSYIFCRSQSQMAAGHICQKGGGMGGRSKRKGTYLWTWPIHFIVPQKLTQYGKAVTFQYKIK